ncbi:MAG: heat shock protein HtpX [Candidatus Woesearchaeota archaeon]|nr:heat shock protein HtpX [Candidatus Woesearchaeota archaeon]
MVIKMGGVNFYDEIKHNKIKSWLLLIFSITFTALFIWVITVAFGLDAYIMLIFAIIISLTSSYFSYINSDKIALSMVKAYPAEGAKFRHLNNMVEGLAIAAGIPKPKVYVMPSQEINAFATGRDPEHAVVCVTEGSLNQLTDSELEGVLGHELSHIKHYDIRYVTIATIVVGLVSILSEILLRSLWFRSGDDRNNGNAIFLIIGIILAILAPIVLRLVYFAISRKREFMADAGSVELTRNPKGLISALKKIQHFYSQNQKTKISRNLAPMYISDPYALIRKAFSTHPPIEERIKKLEKM